jgi:polyisoprenoid-binding protein YceI
MLGFNNAAVVPVCGGPNRSTGAVADELYNSFHNSCIAPASLYTQFYILNFIIMETTTKSATATWTLDKAHSDLQFKAKHLMITTVTGSFADFDLTVTNAGPDFEGAKIELEARTASVTTGNPQRDGHLHGADFFDAENFPVLQFKSDKFTRINDEEYELTGSLTIKGISKPVTLKVEYGGTTTDPWGNTKAGFELHGKISRKDFGLTWNAVTETGGLLVSDEIKIYANVQLLKANQ